MRVTLNLQKRGKEEASNPPTSVTLKVSNEGKRGRFLIWTGFFLSNDMIPDIIGDSDLTSDLTFT